MANRIHETQPRPHPALHIRAIRIKSSCSNFCRACANVDWGFVSIGPQFATRRPRRGWGPFFERKDALHLTSLSRREAGRWRYRKNARKEGDGGIRYCIAATDRHGLSGGARVSPTTSRRRSVGFLRPSIFARPKTAHNHHPPRTHAAPQPPPSPAVPITKRRRLLPPGRSRKKYLAVGIYRRNLSGVAEKYSYVTRDNPRYRLMPLLPTTNNAIFTLLRIWRGRLRYINLDTPLASRACVLGHQSRRQTWTRGRMILLDRNQATPVWWEIARGEPVAYLLRPVYHVESALSLDWRISTGRSAVRPNPSRTSTYQQQSGISGPRPTRPYINDKLSRRGGDASRTPTERMRQPNSEDLRFLPDITPFRLFLAVAFMFRNCLSASASHRSKIEILYFRFRYRHETAGVGPILFYC